MNTETPTPSLNCVVTALKRDKIKTILKQCFACGKFLPRGRWMMQNNEMRAPLCENCSEYAD